MYEPLSVILYYFSKMFPTSSQRKHWLFSGTTEINSLRAKANQAFIKEFGDAEKVSKRERDQFIRLKKSLYLLS